MVLRLVGEELEMDLRPVVARSDWVEPKKGSLKPAHVAADILIICGIKLTGRYVNSRDTCR
jgi:hypothetical protein